jgi:hypothetical protein
MVKWQAWPESLAPPEPSGTSFRKIMIPISHAIGLSVPTANWGDIIGAPLARPKFWRVNVKIQITPACRTGRNDKPNPSQKKGGGKGQNFVFELDLIFVI